MDNKPAAQAPTAPGSQPQENACDGGGEASLIMQSLRQDLSLLGCIAMGADGVLRSLTADREVIDAIGLDPSQIASFERQLPPSMRDPKRDETVDGTKVPREKWYSPDAGMLPPPLSQEARDRSRQRMEENPELYEKARERLRVTWEAKKDTEGDHRGGD